VAKYCDKHACLSACAPGYLRNHTRDLYQFFCACCLWPLAVARSSFSRVVKSQGEGVVLGVSFPTNSALYSIAFGTHTKTAEPIEMSFGMMTPVGSRYHVLDGGPDAKRKGQFWAENAKSKITSLPLPRSLQIRMKCICLYYCADKSVIATHK